MINEPSIKIRVGSTIYKLVPDKECGPYAFILKRYKIIDMYYTDKAIAIIAPSDNINSTETIILNKDNLTNFYYDENDQSYIAFFENNIKEKCQFKLHGGMIKGGIVENTILCDYYYHVKRKDGLTWLHFPKCNCDNCPKLKPDLLEGEKPLDE